MGDSNLVAFEFTADWASRRLSWRSGHGGRAFGGQLIWGSGGVVAAVAFAPASPFRPRLLDIGIKTDLLRGDVLVLAVSDVAAAVSPATSERAAWRGLAVLPLTVMDRGFLEAAGATGLPGGWHRS